MLAQKGRDREKRFSVESVRLSQRSYEKKRDSIRKVKVQRRSRESKAPVRARRGAIICRAHLQREARGARRCSTTRRGAPRRRARPGARISNQSQRLPRSITVGICFGILQHSYHQPKSIDREAKREKTQKVANKTNRSNDPAQPKTNRTNADTTWTLGTDSRIH